MGEYIETKKYGVIKLGTCEDLTYFTYDEVVTLVNDATEANNNPRDFITPGSGWYYRFPFPWEETAIKDGIVIEKSRGLDDSFTTSTPWDDIGNIAICGTKLVDGHFRVLFRKLSDGRLYSLSRSDAYELRDHMLTSGNIDNIRVASVIDGLYVNREWLRS